MPIACDLTAGPRANGMKLRHIGFSDVAVCSHLDPLADKLVDQLPAR